MELTFACKTFPIDQVLRCSFGLSTAEFRILKTLMARGEKSVEDVANTLGKDRTTVQRSMKHLVEKGLVKRRQYNLDGGGYQYYYQPAEKESIKARLQAQFESFSRMVKAEIERW